MVFCFKPLTTADCVATVALTDVVLSLAPVVELQLVAEVPSFRFYWEEGEPLEYVFL